MAEYEPAEIKGAVQIAEGRGGQREWLLSDSEDGGETVLEPEPLFASPLDRIAKTAPRRKVEPLRPNRVIAEGLPLDRIIHGDCFNLIRELPDQSVHLVVTSPPYFQQRDYGAGMGGEKDIAEYIENLLTLFRECLRVTASDGSLVFNLGDKYLESSLMLVPYRFATAAPNTLNFQGRLAKKDGTPVPDGARTVTFRIYDAQTGGSVKWAEQIGSLLIKNGVFSAILGRTFSFNDTTLSGVSA